MIFIKGDKLKLESLSEELYPGRDPENTTKYLFGVKKHPSNSDLAYSEIPDYYVEDTRNKLSNDKYIGIIETSYEELVTEGYILEVTE